MRTVRLELRLLRYIGPFWLVFLLPGSAVAQADRDFRYENPSPAFLAGEGPTVCFDSAHNNYHTVDGDYFPFAELLRRDGYGARTLETNFTETALEGCRVLVITTPVHPSNREDWAFPHRSAFDTDEIRVVFDWVHRGGGLLLVIDHPPIAGAVADLAAVFGAAIFDGEARNDTRSPLPAVFSRAEGALRDHSITRGRGARESVTTVATWTGAAFLGSREFEPVMVYGERSRAWAELPETLPDLPRREYPVFEIEGWLAAGTRQVGQGRLVLLGETAMCTAQKDDDGPWGMNTEQGAENAQFCLNAVRWLSEVLN